MRRDYARRNFSPKKSRKSYFYSWLILLLLFAALIFGLLFFKSLPINLIQKVTTVKQQTLGAIVTKKSITPKFDFYNILPQKKVSKPESTETTYELEIAIVGNYAAADHLKAELALLGFAASVTPIYQQNIQKYSVSIGPYGTKDRAIIDQERLKTDKVKSVLKKVH